MVTHGIKLKSWAFSAVLVLIFTIVAMAATFQNYIGKTAKQLSGMSAGKVDIASSTYWYNKVYTPMQSIVQRLNRYRYAADYASNISAAVDSGGVVTFLPQDTINVNASLDVGSNIALIGYGESSVIKGTKSTYSTGMPIIDCHDDSNIIIQGIHFKPDTSQVYAIEHDHCINLVRCKNIVIKDCIFDCVGDGVCLSADDVGDIPNKNIIITNCIFRGKDYNPDHWALPMSRNGVSVIHGDGVLITDCIFEGFVGPGCIDVEPNPGMSNYASDITISDNIIRTSTNGIIVNCTDGLFHRVSVINNNISYIGYTYPDAYPGYGIHFVDYGYTDEGYYSIRNNTVTGMLDNGIFVRNMRCGGLVADNIVSGCAGNGIQISTPAYGAVVRDNKVYDNGNSGIHVYGEYATVTASALINRNFEFTTGWLDYGTPLVTERTSAHKKQGTYSWKIRTDAADEGIYQVVTTDSQYYYMAKCYVYMYDDSAFSKVEMDVSGGYNKLILNKARESAYDSTWQLLSVVFQPSGDDTVIIKSTIGGCHFYVDQLTIVKFGPGESMQITGNECVNNEYCGIRIEGYVLRSDVNNNQTYNKRQWTTDTLKQDYGILAGDALIRSSFLNNRGWDNIEYDCYVNDLLNCDISFRGFERLYWDVIATEFFGNIYPFARVIAVRGMVYPDSIITNFGGNWNMLEQGRLLGISANCDSAFTAGIIYIFPKIGDTYHSTSPYIAGTISFKSTGSITGRNQLFNSYETDREFKLGDRLSIYIQADAYVPDTTWVNVMLLYE